MAAERLTADGVDVLHTIGGDDTNTTAADLAAFLAATRATTSPWSGLPKTIDNDVVPIRQCLGAWTAAEQGALFARNVVAEHDVEPADAHRPRGHGPGLRLADRRDRRAATTGGSRRAGVVAGDRLTSGALGRPRASTCPSSASTWTPRRERLRAVMDEIGCVNLFLSEGAGVRDDRRRARGPGEEVPRDPFGHVKLDTINPGAWFAKQFAERLGAEKTMVQKSGYFSRSAAANARTSR